MHASLRASSVDSVVRVTGNFASEAPLPQVVRDSLLAAFDQGWADPKKLSQASARAAILRNQAMENIAHRLNIPFESIEVLGEPSLGHFLSITGFLSRDSTFLYSAIDKGKIRAIARKHLGDSVELSVNEEGQVLYPNVMPANSVLSLQLANGETGILQNDLSAAENAQFIAVDATSSGTRIPLPKKWDSALFDAQSWNGPGGLAILAISNRSRFAYPLPHIAPISSPGSYSLPLLIAASVALENFQAESQEMRIYLATGLNKINDLRIVGESSTSMPHIISCVISGVNNEMLVRELAAIGVDIDAGSACSPVDLQPSHVIAAMGYPTEGQIRFTLKRQTEKSDIDGALAKLEEIVAKLRS